MSSGHYLYALDFSYWKRRPLRLCFPNARLRFISDPAQAPDGATLIVWGMRSVADAHVRRLQVVRIEDGFLRSVGLGADLISPLSWVIDWRGIYFNATEPSDLEAILADTDFAPDLLKRARALREQIVATGLTKYNVGSLIWSRPVHARHIILVPGQVESDASLAFGAPGIKTNLDLLKAVRAANSEAYILYKPHPDVAAGLRKPGAGEDQVERWCDEIIVDVPMGVLLREVDEVHCITSLAGFEALLRGKLVTCYGQPFYAGWGLTTDILPIMRRQRRLTIDELVAGALIIYPRYMSRKREALITPEEALQELAEWQAASGGKTSNWRKAFRVVLRHIVGVR